MSLQWGSAQSTGRSAIRRRCRCLNSSGHKVCDGAACESWRQLLHESFLLYVDVWRPRSHSFLNLNPNPKPHLQILCRSPCPNRRVSRTQSCLMEWYQSAIKRRAPEDGDSSFPRPHPSMFEQLNALCSSSIAPWLTCSPTNAISTAYTSFQLTTLAITSSLKRIMAKLAFFSAASSRAFHGRVG